MIIIFIIIFFFKNLLVVQRILLLCQFPLALLSHVLIARVLIFNKGCDEYFSFCGNFPFQAYKAMGIYISKTWILPCDASFLMTKETKILPRFLVVVMPCLYYYSKVK